ncbi:MAG: hypothetical protein RLO01_05520 [Thalassobaculaceae bacterium]
MRHVAKIALTLLAGAVVLSGCAPRSVPIVGNGPLQLSQDKGAILFVLQRDPLLLQTPLTMTIRQYNPATGRFIGASRAGEEDADNPNVIEVKYATQAQLGRNDRYWTYVVPPGHYAIESVEITKTYSNVQFIGGNPIVGLAATLVVAAASAAAAEMAHEQITFSNDGRLTPDAPRFTVSGGQATYIGDFSFQGEEQVTQVTTTRSFNDPDLNETRSVSDLRIILDYQFHPEGIAWYAERRGLGAGQIVGQRLAAFDDARFMVKDFSSAQQDRRKLARAPSMEAPARTSGSVALPPSTNVPPSASALPSAPPAGSKQRLSTLPQAELQRRFLAGEISMEEYNTARAGQ